VEEHRRASGEAVEAAVGIDEYVHNVRPGADAGRTTRFVGVPTRRT